MKTRRTLRKNTNNYVQAKKQSGITLIALVITIVVLLILAWISIVALFGENGLITSTQNAAVIYLNAEEKEREEMDRIADLLEGENIDTSEIDKKLVLQNHIQYVDSTDELDNPDRGFYKPVSIAISGDGFDTKIEDMQKNAILRKKIK